MFNLLGNPDDTSHTAIMPKKTYKREPKLKRKQLPLSVRMEMVRLKDAGKRTKEICDFFHGKYTASTICGQFSKKGRARIQKDIKNKAPPNATRTSYLRPPIISDMEAVLYELMKRERPITSCITKNYICTQAKHIIAFLNETGYYDFEGQRITANNIATVDELIDMFHNSVKSSQMAHAFLPNEAPSELAERTSSDDPEQIKLESIPIAKAHYLFKASHGWWSHFKERYQISKEMLQGDQEFAEKKDSEIHIEEFTLNETLPTDIIQERKCKKADKRMKNRENGRPKLTRKQVPLSDRLEMVKLKDAGKRTRDIYYHFHGKYTVSTICSQFSESGRARIRKDIKNKAPPNTTRTNYLRPPIITDMEIMLYELIKRGRLMHLSFTKDLISVQARNIFDFLNKTGDYESDGQRKSNHNVTADDNSSNTESVSSHENTEILSDLIPSTKVYYLFKASNGWWSNFKERYQISKEMLGSNQEFADKNDRELFVKEFTTKLSLRYRPKEALCITISISETGVQYKSVPSRSCMKSGDTIKAKKPVMARLAVIFATAGDGHKFKLLVIGKAKRPMALSKEDMNRLPVHYAYNPLAYLTEEIMINWFTSHLIPEIRECYGDKHVIVTLDNCSAQPETLKSLDSNIEVEFLPTSPIQPIDQCVIMSFKSLFKSKYYTKMVEYSVNNLKCDDPYTSFLKKYTIKDALFDFADAWHNVSENTVKKSFNKIIDKNMLVRLYNNRVTKDEYASFSDVADNLHLDEDSAFRTSQDITGRLNQCAEERQDGTCYSQAAVTEDILYSPGVHDKVIANLFDELIRQPEDEGDVRDMQEAPTPIIQQNITASLQKLSELDYSHDVLGLTTLEIEKYQEHLKGIREILNASVLRNYPANLFENYPSTPVAQKAQFRHIFTPSVRLKQEVPDEVLITDENPSDDISMIWLKKEQNEDNSFES